MLQPTPEKPFLTLSGQAFWEYISGAADSYVQLTRALATAPVVQPARYHVAFESAVARFTEPFSTQFCDADGQIDWEVLTQFNSGIREKRKATTKSRLPRKP